jgi:hypothetical protein
MMPARPRVRRFLLPAIVLGVATACSTEAPSHADIDRCALLSEDEIAAVIGPHDGGRTGSADNQSQYGNDSCRWVAREAPYLFVELAVFGPRTEAWAREQASGEAVAALAGARYDQTSAELWFDCAGKRFCSLQVYTSDGPNLDTTLALARQAERRL